MVGFATVESLNSNPVSEFPGSSVLLSPSNTDPRFEEAMLMASAVTSSMIELLRLSESKLYSSNVDLLRES